METLLQDLKYGFRILLKNPGFTTVAILTLALGIGANTALFSIVNAVLLDPLPYPHSEQLVTLYESKPHFEKGSFSYLDFLDLQSQNHSFSSVAAYRDTGYTLSGSGPSERVTAEMVTGELFAMLGIKPILGRLFTPQEDRLGAPPVVLLGDELWKRKFRSDSEIVGKEIALDGKGYTVVGVVPSSLGLFIQNFNNKRGVYVLMGQFDDNEFRKRVTGWGTDGVARLKPGVTLDQARADTAGIARRLATDYPDIDKGIGVLIVPLKEEMVGDVQPFLLVLLGAVGFVLLIACVNVANLLLSRATARTREFAVRLALGASQARVIRQLLTESVLLALAGGILGLLLAKWATLASLHWLPRSLPRADNIGLDVRVLVFTFAISVLAGVLFGLAPALRISTTNLYDTIKQGGRGFSAGRHRTQSVLVTAEMAMALVLLIGAGLMVRTLTRLWNVDPGFDPHHVQIFSISASLPNSHPSQEAVASAVRQIHEKVKATPGVDAVSLSWGAFPMLSDDETQFWIEGQPKPASVKDMDWTLEYDIEPDFFKVMGIELKRGRLLNDQDNSQHSPTVVVVDERFAQKFFPNQDVPGRHIFLYRYDKTAEIVGVVRHIKQFGLGADDSSSLQAQAYIPLMQLVDQVQSVASIDANVFVRSNQDETALEDRLRSNLQEAGGQFTIGFPTSMDKAVRKSVASQRFFMLLLGAFAFLALVLASVGIYGVVSYVVGERTREIGIRMALGAQRIDVLRMVLQQGLMMALAGVAIGVAAAMGVTRLMSSMLYGVTSSDPATFGAVGLLLCAVAILACYVPAHRAARVDPIVALRYE